MQDEKNLIGFDRHAGLLNVDVEVCFARNLACVRSLASDICGHGE